MTEHEAAASAEEEGSANVLLAAYRHDAHKFTGEAHADASDRLAGVTVNQPVPHGADADAAALSRPRGDPEQTVDTHASHYRLSLLTGTSQYDANTGAQRHTAAAIRDLLTESDPATMHERWLTSDVAAAFNESVYYPYTSLKYHTLLVAALLVNYRAGQDFAELELVADSLETIVPHRTVYVGDRFTLRIDAPAAGRPAARLGARPRRSWAAVWARLPAHPLDTDGTRTAMVLDANLRRMRAWSTALQYLEDFETEVGDR